MTTAMRKELRSIYLPSLPKLASPCKAVLAKAPERGLPITATDMVAAFQLFDTYVHILQGVPNLQSTNNLPLRSGIEDAGTGLLDSVILPRTE